MSEIKTVTYEGNVYQIGGVYEFADWGDNWHLDVLESIEREKDYPFYADGNGWKLIRESKSKIGTITPAPIELVDGAAYMFNVRGGRQYVGIYDEGQDIFSISQGQWVYLEKATNIRLMTVGSE